MKNKDMIINRPDLLKGSQKYTAMGLTLFFWGALIYLWQPAISLLAWALNLNVFYEHMVVLGGYRTFVNLLINYATVIGILAGALLLWARINQWRFSGLDRRVGIEVTDIDAVCATFAVNRDSVKEWRECSNLIVDTDDEGLVLEVVVIDSAPKVSDFLTLE